jgi:hypothetical protein
VTAGTLQVTHQYAEMDDQTLLLEAAALEAKLALVTH